MILFMPEITKPNSAKGKRNLKPDDDIKDEDILKNCLHK
jgi:hypothetical protein